MVVPMLLWERVIFYYNNLKLTLVDVEEIDTLRVIFCTRTSLDYVVNYWKRS